jgi:hypothetical protein
MKVYGGVDLELHLLLISALLGDQLYATAALPAGKYPPVPIG